MVISLPKLIAQQARPADVEHVDLRALGDHAGHRRLAAQAAEIDERRRGREARDLVDAVQLALHVAEQGPPRGVVTQRQGAGEQLARFV
jgi:hypothetical protein